MGTFVFAMPLLPGKEAVDREMLERLGAAGPERDAYLAARRAQGVSHETVWHQRTPMGTFAIVLLEADDVATSFGLIATSDEPFARQFRDFVKDVHGVDMAKDPPPDVELVIDTRF